MREFLDNILFWIGATSLTDGEFSSIQITQEEYNVETYQALDQVLESRESISSMRDKLKFLFKSKGVDLPSDQKAKSNIFVGSPL